MPTFDLPNAPDVELSRSPAAARVGHLAAASGLLLGHFEHRAHLPAPDDWVPADRPDLLGTPTWQGGRLVEHKYAHFRYDNPVGSFHPGHRAKWTAHELCHALAGFAWRPGASPLFHHCAARLAEVVPVALYYFFDEAFLRRCPAHAGGGPLFGAFCPACERAAADGPREADPEAERWFDAGLAYVRAEIDAVARTRATGRPVAHRHATLNLASDATAYVAAHRARLESPTQARFVERFLGPGQAAFDDLDALVAHVEALAAHLCGRGRGAPLVGGRDLFVAADVGWRLMQVAAECEGEVAHALDDLAERLAAAPGEATLAAVIDAYTDLHAEWVLPEPVELFAVGYDLPGGYGRLVEQVAEGLTEVLPGAVKALGDAFDVLVDRFVDAEPPTRGPVARRFADFLAAEAPGAAADLARYEAAVAHTAPPDAALDAFAGHPGADARLRRADGLEVLALGWSMEGPDALTPRPHHRAVRRTSGGDVVVAEISDAAAAALARLDAEGPLLPEALGLAPAELEALIAGGLVGPAAWPA
ncbi:MAG: hypothetical protein H6704_29540 [Myxococcales bacterium]|nr:hypothetical protein [Myxococcales bacterium]